MMLYLRMIACWLEHTRLFDLIGEREREELKKVSQKSALRSLFWEGEEKVYAQSLHRHRVVQPPPPHTTARAKKSIA